MTLTNIHLDTVNNGLNVATIERLRANIRGSVITPQDADYDEARIRLSNEVVRHPALIIRPLDAGDVAEGVRLARDTGLELAIRSGGHSLSGFGTSDGGIVLDLSLMKNIEIDVETRTAWAETGLTAGEYTAAAAKFGLATGFGDTASVGIGGLTTGGGIGYLVRKYGLTIDNVLAARVVTADGHVRYVDEESFPDLFWAIRGGGGNFGVVTHFKYQLHPVDTIVGGLLILPPEPAVIAKFAEMSAAAPDELSSIVSIMAAPPMPFLPPHLHGQLIMMAAMVYTGDIEEGMRVVAPFRTIAEPIADLLGPMPYPQIYMPEDPNFRPKTALRSKFIDKVDEHTAEIMVNHVRAATADMAIAEFRVLGGAMARVPAGATAFAHRSAGVMASFIALHLDPAEADIHTAWAVNAVEDLGPSASVYVNFVGEEGKARLNDAYPNATRERLAEVKARYDPTNLFRKNHNIAPKAK